MLDAMASWWTAIHGHGHPVLDEALTSQLRVMNHVMFGAHPRTRSPAGAASRRHHPVGTGHRVLLDSGSVSVEVAVKMALQYWRSTGRFSKSVS